MKAEDRIVQAVALEFVAAYLKEFRARPTPAVLGAFRDRVAAAVSRVLTQEVSSPFTDSDEEPTTRERLKLPR